MAARAAHTCTHPRGPHVVQAVTALDNILQRMQAHSSKKRSMLRELALARGFLEAAPA